MVIRESQGGGVALPDTSRNLLARARNPSDASSWLRLWELYGPLIRNWVRPYVAQPADADDVVQDVMTVLVDELPRFEHNGRPGAFRSWLRAIAVNRLRGYWYAQRGVQGSGESSVMERLKQLEDPTSSLTQSWNDEHDRHVAELLLESIRLEFKPATWHAFLATTREGRPAPDVAAELGLSVNAVQIAKSRVIKRLRQKAQSLFD